MPIGGPQFQFRVARRVQPHQEIVVIPADVDPRDHLRMAAIEAFGEPDKRAQQPHDPPG